MLYPKNEQLKFYMVANYLMYKNGEFPDWELPGVDDGIICADLGEEAGDALGERPLLVLAYKEGHGGVGGDDLLHPVEELLTTNGLGADPHLLLPVAHGVGVRRAVLVPGTDEVVGQVRAGAGPRALYGEVGGDLLLRLRQHQGDGADGGQGPRHRGPVVLVLLFQIEPFPGPEIA